MTDAQFKFCPLCATQLVKKTIEDKDRLSCPACKYVHWNNPIPVVAALLRHDDEYLLVRGRGWPENLFSFVSGFLEPGETPEECIMREIKEELDLDAHTVCFLSYYSLHRFNQIIFTYVVDVSGEVTFNQEIEEAKYVTSEELQQYDFGPLDFTREMVELYFEEKSRSQEEDNINGDNDKNGG